MFTGWLLSKNAIICVSLFLTTVFTDGNDAALRYITHCGTEFIIENGYANFGGEDKGIGHSVPITCKTGYQLIGSKHTTCLADRSWSRNTTCRIRDSGTLVSLQLGTVDFTGRRTVYNEIVPVSCVSGYETRGPTVLTCRDDGTWSRDTTCVKKDCGAAFNLPNGRVMFEGRDTRFGSKVPVTCNDGYKLSGDNHITCTSDGSWTKHTQCVIRDCGTVATIQNGYANFTDKVTTVGAAVPIICNKGYRLHGPNIITCLPTGLWSRATECIIKDCGKSFDIPSGYANFPGRKTTYQQIIPILCNEGYNIVGNDFITCEADGSWSKGSSCRIRDCGKEFTLDNGHIDFKGIATTYNQKAPVSCNKGHVLVGEPKITCMGTGRWSDDTKCIPRDCGSNYSIPNAQIHYRGISTYNQRLSVTCNKGYKMTGDGFVTCRSDGSWSKATSCRVTKCPVSFKLAHGVVLFRNVTYVYQDIVAVSCITGYKLRGSGLITCLDDGSWSTDSSCSVADCGTKFELEHGEADFTGVTTTYGNKAGISCDLGYSLQGDEYTICQAEGTWSRFSRCLIKDCGTVFSLQFGYADFAGKPTTYDHKIPVVCDTGYGLIGDQLIKCQANGKWTNNTICAVKSCKNNLIINNGVVHFYDEKETLFQETIEITCNTGYQLHGDNTTTCQQDGSWSMNSVCRIKDCGMNISIPNGEVTFNMDQKTTFNETARVSCKDGYELQGKNLIRCQEDGIWSQTVCVEVSSLALYIGVAAGCGVIFISLIVAIIILKKKRKLCFAGRWHKGLLF